VVSEPDLELENGVWNFSALIGQVGSDGLRWETRVVNDAELIERSLGDGVSFAQLFDRHYGSIHRFVCARVGPELADDLASETFAVAFRRRNTYDLTRGDARPWLYGIAVNLLHAQRRSEVRRLRAYARAAEHPTPERPTGRLDEGLASALLDLTEQERNLILLYAWAELSYEQLAEALGLPIGTVRSRLSRTRAKLRARLLPTETVVLGGGKAS
jgi:RNA polymerase sigma factor (sigma-70 family)